MEKKKATLVKSLLLFGSIYALSILIFVAAYNHPWAFTI